MVKSHGGANAAGIASAIDLAVDVSSANLVDKIAADLDVITEWSDQAELEQGSGGCIVSIRRSVITGVGSYLPKKVVTNDDLAKIVDTSDEWIVERSGIRQRHMVEEGETTSDLALAAAKAALADAGVDAQDIDLIVMATTTPDNTFPATATTVQAALGIEHGAAFDLQAVCSGFVFGLSTADNFLKAGQFNNALVIGAETFSRLLDFEDRTTCVLFGDGAGAVVLQAQEGEGTIEDRGVHTAHLHSDGPLQREAVCRWWPLFNADRRACAHAWTRCVQACRCKYRGCDQRGA